jgi:MFS family permease
MSRKPSLLIIFLTVFIDLVGFGIVLPLLPQYAENSHGYRANWIELGLLMASFSAMQFFFAPVWGRLSDRVGRRPILLLSTAGAVGSYVLFAFAARIEGAAGVWLIIASRAFAGLCGANITVAQAYIADISAPSERSKKMGLIGMAFGLGFIFGPPIGVVSFNYFGVSGPGICAAALCAANLILAFFVLAESWTPSAAHAAQRPHLEQWKHTMSLPTIRLLIVIFFLATFCFTAFELTLGLMVAENFGLELRTPPAIKVAGILLAYSGIIGAFVQGGPIGKLVKSMGERKLIVMSLFFTALGLAPLPFIHGSGALSWSLLFSSQGASWWLLLAVLAVLAIGSGLTRPPLFGLLSVLTPATEQGVTIGIAQGAGSLARIVGPLFAAAAYKAHPRLLYVGCGAICLVTGLIAWQYLVARQTAAAAAPAQT